MGADPVVVAPFLRLRGDGAERAFEGVGGLPAGDQVFLVDDHGRDRADAGLVPLALQRADVVGEAAGGQHVAGGHGVEAARSAAVTSTSWSPGFSPRVK